MVSITYLSRIVKSLTKTEQAVGIAASNRTAFDFFKKLTSGYGKDISPVIYKGEHIKELPELFQSMTTGLKRPSVTVVARSRVKGQGLLGISVKDGNKTIGNSAIAYDCTKGEPIFQARGNYGNGEHKAVEFSVLFDTNKSGKDIMKLDLSTHKKTAAELGIAEKLSQIKKLPQKQLEERAKDFKAFIKNRGCGFYSVDECLPDFVKIASKTGKVTEQSAKKRSR